MRPERTKNAPYRPAARVWRALAPAAVCLIAGCAAMAPDSGRFPREAPSATEARPFERPGVPGPAESAFEAAWALLARGEYTGAEEAFGTWLRSHGDAGAPRTAQVWFWLGYCREKLGRAEEARRAYRTLTESFPASGAAGRARQRLKGLARP